MKRIMYLCLLIAIPFLIHADHGRNQLNGRWISPYFNKQIKVKVKRNEIRVKGLSNRRWTSFTAIRWNVFEDCDGNRIKINNIHDLVYINRYLGKHIHFVKKGHIHQNHVCNARCSIRYDYFSPHGNGFNNTFEDNYFDDWDDDSWGNFGGRKNKGSFDQEDRKFRFNNNGFSGKYHVREIDEYITIKRTNSGLKAKRGNGNWINYKQNRNRKNEYIDSKGNKYLVRSENEITWKNKNGTVSLNLKK